jgi:hypothetical protein
MVSPIVKPGTTVPVTIFAVAAEPLPVPRRIIDNVDHLFLEAAPAGIVEQSRHDRRRLPSHCSGQAVVLGCEPLPVYAFAITGGVLRRSPSSVVKRATPHVPESSDPRFVAPEQIPARDGTGA